MAIASDPILLLGGSGVVGRQVARYLREAHTELPLLIGGRDAQKAKGIAAEVGNAEGVSLDLAKADLGLGDRAVSAVAVLVKDDALAGLSFALDRNAPHLSISSGVQEIGQEVAAFMYAPHSSAIVLGTEWLVGATTVPTLALAAAFRRIESIAIGALIDEQDSIGPAADYDMERLGKTLPAAMTKSDGAWMWRVGEEAKTGFRAIDGTHIEATAYAANDVFALAAKTGARDVRFDLATGISSSRRRGEPPSTEIIIELAGVGANGAPLKTRHAVFHPHGQVPLTALGVAMVLERVLGLDGDAPPGPGLYFPAQLLGSEAYHARLRSIGGKVIALEP